MINIIKGFDTKIDDLSLESFGSATLAGTSANYTLSGTTYSGTTLTIPAADVATVPTGDYALYVITSAVQLIKVSEVTVKDFAYEKSHYRIVLEALQATLEGRATKEQQEVQVGGRMVRYLPLTELISAINQYKRLVEQEEVRNSISSGNSFSGIIRTRWGH